MPKKLPLFGRANMRNLDAMVAAGELTKAEADKIRKEHARKNKQKGKK